MESLIIGVDLGATRIRAALVTPEGEIRQTASRLTLAQEGPGAVWGRIRAAIAEVFPAERPEIVLGIGVGAPGPLDPWRGVAIAPVNLPGWHDVPLRDMIVDAFGRPAFVNNDANVAALGEHRFGAGRGVHHLIYMTISTGIGGGIIVDDRLLLGTHGLAGEIGHMTLEPNGPRCACGNVGCLEALASGPAIAAWVRGEIQKGVRSVVVDMIEDPSVITAEMVSRAAQEGDELCREALRRAGFYIGVHLVNLVHCFDPELIILGGGVTGAGEFLFAPIRATVAERVMPSFGQVRIVPAALGEHVGTLGAVALVLSSLQA